LLLFVYAAACLPLLLCWHPPPRRHPDPERSRMGKDPCISSLLVLAVVRSGFCSFYVASQKQSTSSSNKLNLSRHPDPERSRMGGGSPYFVVACFMPLLLGLPRL
jgi:hypothetical protein